MRSLSDERARALLQELDSAERLSREAIAAAIRRRYQEAIARRGQLLGQLLALNAQIARLREDMSSLEQRNRELLFAVQELHAAIGRLQTYRRELDEKIQRLPAERTRLRNQYVQAAQRSRAVRTRFWNTLSAAVAPARLEPPRYYTPPVRLLPPETQRRPSLPSGVPAGPLASAIAQPRGVSAGELARAIPGPPTGLQPLIQDVIAVREENVRRDREVQLLAGDRETLTTRVESLRPLVAGRVAQQTQLTTERNGLTREVDAGSRRLLGGIAAMVPDFQAFWRTAKEELLWDAAVQTLEGAIGATTGRGEALRSAMEQTLNGWDRVLSVLPAAVGEAGSPDENPPHVQAYVLTMLFMYPEDEPLPTPGTSGEQRILDAARSGQGAEIMRGKVRDPFRPPEWGFRKMVYPGKGDAYPSPGDRQVHYWYNEFTGRRFGFKFKSR